MSQSVKRKREDALLKPRKRAVTTTNAARAPRSAAVRGDQLRWKEVQTSTHLDNAEGFFGLEELSDVEVVQDGNGKGVLFQPAIGHVAGSEPEISSPESDTEWSGFSEVGSEVNDIVSSPAETASSPVVDYHDPLQKPSLSKHVPQEAQDQLFQHDGISVLNSMDVDPDIDMTAWNDLELSSPMISALSALGFSKPTQIQQSAIPQIMEGRDVIGKAVTGSGKTLAFGLPIIETWLASQRSPKDSATFSALVLAPTRELAHQISKHLFAICENLDLAPRVATVTGGLSVLKQRRQLETANIVVATPGRLWEVISDSAELLEKLRGIRFLVVDEADRLLSEGHFKEVEEILDALDRKIIEEDEQASPEHDEKHARQVLVFSATFHKGLQQKLSSKQKKRSDKDSNLLSDKQSMEYLMHKLPFQTEHKPVFIDANPDSQLAERLSETILECKAMEKDLYLYGFLVQDQYQRRKAVKNVQEEGKTTTAARILVFTNSVSAVKRLVPLLQSLEMASTSISALHSNMPQKSRLRSLERFSGTTDSTNNAATTVLVSTDVAARGLDIKGITTIVHYHVPRTADTYVHRSGRTARVDASGSSVLLCSPDETASVTKLIAKVHTSSHRSTSKEMSALVDRMYLPNDLLRQVSVQVELAQKLVESLQSTDKVRSEDNWLRNAAEELGVDYDSDEFEQAGKQGRRGRGGEKDRRQKKVAKQQATQSHVVQWKAQLKEALSKRLDFGDGAGRSFKYLAGGAFDVEKLLAERDNK